MINRQYLTGAQAVVATLRTHDVDTIFGIPGVHTLPIYDALYHEPGLRHILARHEQGAGFMAEGYARVSGRPGVVCTIAGPGVTNVATPVASAFADSIPLLVISSALSRATDGRRRGELHEVKNQHGVMESLAGWTRVVNHIEEIPGAIADAFRALAQGRPRGAYLQIPCDLLHSSAWVEIPEPWPIERAHPTQQDILAAVKLLREAEQPLLIAGTGVSAADANEQLLQLAELLQSPVILGGKSHDVLPTDHPLVITTNDSLPEALDTFVKSHDVALVVGSKLGAERTAGGRLPLPGNLIHIDIDPLEVGHNYPASVRIVADAKYALEELLLHLRNDPPQRELPAARLRNLQDLREQLHRHMLAFQGEPFKLLEGVRAGLDQLPEDSVVVADMTMLGYAAAQYLPRYQPRTFVHAAELCTIGGGLPTAIGAQMAAPGRPVVALCGDGGILLNIAELATAAQEKLPVIIVVFNDATFTRVKADQKENYAQHYIATDVLAPDYVTLAQAFHVESMRVESPTELARAIQQAAAHATGPTVIEVPFTRNDW